MELKISASADELAPYLRKAAAALSNEREIKGFRPGKAPVDVVEKLFGTERLLHEALDRAVPKLFVEAVLDHDIDALARPNITIEHSGRNEGLTFTARVTVLPQVQLGDLAKITVERRPVTVPEEDIDRELQQLVKMRSTFLDVARPAQHGDTVKVDFRISQGGAVMEGGEANEQAIHIGEGYFLPEFEKKLEGIAAGDEREFAITFPEDYGHKELTGKTAQAWVKAHAVQKRVTPKLDDDFAKSLGKFKDVAELKERLREGIQREREHKEHERQHGEIAEKLAETASFGPLPKMLVDREIDRRLGELNEMLTLQQKTLEEYLASQQKDMAGLREELQAPAEQRVKVGLALRAFAEQEKIEVEDAEVDERVQEYLKRFSSAEEAKKQVDVNELRDHLGYLLRNQRTMGRLEKLVTFTEPKANIETDAPEG